jgi:phosphoglycerate kinase
MIPSIQQASLTEKTVIVRVDYNVPIDENGVITDDKRIRETLPTIEYLLSQHSKIVLMAHYGRPKGTKNLKFSLRFVADYLATIVNVPVLFVDDCIGEEVREKISSAPLSSIILLENVRFYAEEEKNESEFSKQLSLNGDVYVNDAFGAAHRAHASTTGIASFFPTSKYAGLLMEKELRVLKAVTENPKKPFVAIIGGSKISGKIDVIENLMSKCDSIIIGGGMMFTFLRTFGHSTGTSLVEEDKIELAAELIKKAKDNGVELLLPVDVRTSTEFSNSFEPKVFECCEIPDEEMGLDIGPATESNFISVIEKAGTILWNGPMGVFEFSNYEHGTKAIANAIVRATKKGALSVIGGGDSAAAIHQFGLEKDVTHVSTGGGATLEYLEGKVLPGVNALLS